MLSVAQQYRQIVTHDRSSSMEKTEQCKYIGPNDGEDVFNWHKRSITPTSHSAVHTLRHADKRPRRSNERDQKKRGETISRSPPLSVPPRARWSRICDDFKEKSSARVRDSLHFNSSSLTVYRRA